MLEDNRLRIFKAVAEYRNFTAAAKAVGVSQPAVSQAVAELEKSLGARLFDRSRGRVELTLQGATFLEHAERILSEYKSMEKTFGQKNSILVRNVLLNGNVSNILIEGNRFADLSAPSDAVADVVVEGDGKAILPAFYNTHNHAAMSLLRGYADDMPLKTWLNDYIWPYEDKLTAFDIRRGSEIAVKEMTSSGSVFFNDMYFEIEQTIEMVNQSGMRAAIGITVMDNHSKAVTEAKKAFIENFTDPTGGRIQLVMAPHAIYTVGKDKLKKSAEYARAHGMRLHIHLSETEQEVADCIREHGRRPVEYLDSIGFLGPDVIAAHCIHVDEKEWKILAKRGVTVSHCPGSNMKLGSGRFPYALALDSGCRITLGTDGPSSNNNLDMGEEMKLAALLAKVTGDPSLLTAEEVFRWATVNGAEAFGIDAGKIEKGKLADAILVDMTAPRMTPCHNLISNMVYSADSSVITHVICDGKIVFKRQ